MFDQRARHIAVAVDHVEHTRRQTGLPGQLDDALVGEWVLFARLQHERVSRGDGVGPEPHGNHHGKVVGSNPRKNAERLPNRFAVDSGGDVFESRSHHQGGDAARVLYVLDPAPNLASRFGHGLAVLPSEVLGEIIEMLLEEPLQAEQDPGPFDGWGFAPAGERVFGCADGAVHIRSGGEGDVA